MDDPKHQTKSLKSTALINRSEKILDTAHRIRTPEL